MNRINQVIEQYKFAIIAVVAVYIGIFMYLQMETYEQSFEIQPFFEEPRIEVPEEEVKLKPENIQLPPEFQPGDVKNISRDVNDKRKRSDKDWSENIPTEDGASKAKDYEKKLFDETGGDAKRRAMMQEMEERKKDQSAKSNQKSEQPSNTKGGNTAYSGNVMVDWSLSSRTPHQNNNWWIRNPGYTCGYGASGRVTVYIKVNQAGNVISASPVASSGSNQCMIDQAVAYAKKSRFNYSASASAQQEGTITYTFVSQ
jgi:TonB family protein